MRRLPLLLVPAVAATALLTGCGSTGSSDDASAGSSTGSSAAAGAPSSGSPSSGSSSASGSSTAAGGACTYTATGGAAKKVSLPPSTPAPAASLTIGTNRGDIPVTLDRTRTPCTAGSFTSLAKQGYFDGTKCHRLTTSGIFVLQCGDPTATGSGGPGYSFPDELSGSETYPAGTVAMANSGPDTNGSQFFLVYAATPLPASYTVFGKMDASGTAVVKAIAAKGTADGAPDGAPKQDVVIGSVK